MKRTGIGEGTKLRWLSAIALVAILAASCSSDSGTEQVAGDAEPSSEAGGSATDEGEPTEPGPEESADDRSWPGASWASTTAEDAGLDQAALDEMAASAEAADSNCLFVSHDGALVEEWYWNGTDERNAHEVYSVTKSVTSALVGIASDQGLLAIDDPVSEYVEQWQGTPSESVTIANLLSNDSGRYHDFINDFVTLINEDDQTGFAIDLDQQNEPGEVWVYNNAAIQVLDAVIATASGMPTHEFAETNLFEPLGMDSSVLKTDRAGNTLTFMGADMSCGDLARFGLLFLRDGKWDGEQIISQDWVDASVVPSQDLNESYGLLWWLNRDGQVANPDGAGDRDEGLAPDAPMEMFAALGFGSQVLAVYPDSDVIVTRIGGFDEVSEEFGVAEIGAGVVAALGSDR